MCRRPGRAAAARGQRGRRRSGVRARRMARAAASARPMPMTWSGPGAAQRPAHAAQAQPRVGHHDHRAGPPARRRARREVDAGGTSSATRSPGRTPAAASPAAMSPHPRSQQRAAADAGRPPQLDHGRGAVVAARGRSSSAHSRRRRRLGRAGWPRRGARPPAGRPSPAPHVVGVLGASSGSRWLARSKRCRSACGSRSLQVAQVARSRKTGSRGPQSSSAGTSSARAGRRRSASSVGAARMAGVERDVGDELADRLPPGRRRVRRAEGVPDRRAGSRGGTARWWSGRTAGVRAQAIRSQHAARGASRISDGRGRAGRLVHRGVGQHDAAQLVAVLERPAERRSSPPQSWATVTTGPGRCPSASVSAAEVVDPLRRAARGRRCARSSPCPSWSTATTRQPARRLRRAAGATGSDQVGLPCTHSSVPTGLAPARCRGRARRRRTPSASSASTQPGPRAGRARAARAGRPRGRRVRPGGHQTISGIEVFSPEPMPMQQHPVARVQRRRPAGQGERDRRPGRCCRRSGRSAGPGSGRCPAAFDIALVCTCETWCMM